MLLSLQHRGEAEIKAESDTLFALEFELSVEFIIDTVIS